MKAKILEKLLLVVLVKEMLILNKIGYQEEVTLRERFMKDKEVIDEDLFSLL